MILLPFPPRKAQLQSFWLAVSAGVAVVLAIVAALAFGYVWAAVGFALGCLVGIAGWRSRRFQLKLYSVWNRAVSCLADLGYRWTLFLTHRLFLAAIGPEGSRFDRVGGMRTNWTPHTGSEPIDEVSWRGWSREYLRWASMRGNRWGLMMWPFLVTLALFKKEEATTSVPSNIYTLF